MSGTQANPIGITNPPIDDLLTKADSKYALVIYSAKLAVVSCATSSWWLWLTWPLAYHLGLTTGGISVDW